MCAGISRIQSTYLAVMRRRNSRFVGRSSSREQIYALLHP